MEILCITHKYPPFVGGMEKQSYELITSLRKNHTVHSICFTGENQSKFQFFFGLKAKVKKLLKENPSIDIIHLNDGLMALVVPWIKKMTNIPVVVTFHGLDLVFPNTWYQKRIRNKISNLDGFICVSSATAQECKTRNIEDDKVYVVPNGVDHDIANHKSKKSETLNQILDTYNVDLRDKYILCTVGRPVKRKGFSWFLNHVIPVLPEKVQLIMIGDFKVPKKKWFHALMPSKVVEQLKLMQGGLSDEAEIYQWTQESEYTDRILQTGKIPLDFLLDILQNADIFIMPNISMPGDAEGFGLVALEASISGTTVLASSLEGITEAIQDNKNGYLLESRNVEAWRTKIMEVLDNPEKESIKAQEFKEFTLSNYSWDKMAAGYEKVFKRIIEK